MTTTPSQPTPPSFLGKLSGAALSLMPALQAPRKRAAQRFLAAARAAYGAKKWDEAARAVSRAIALDAGNDESFRLLGHIRYDRGDPAAAEKAFRRACDLNFNQPDNVYWLGVALHALGRFSEAAYCYSRCLELKAETGLLWVNLVGAHIGGGQYAEALAKGKQAVEKFPQEPLLWLYLAEAHYQTGELGPALESALQSEKLDPKQAAAVRFSGMVYAALGEHEQAIRKLQQAIALEPEDIYSYLQLGASSQRVGKVDEALAMVRRGRELAEKTGNAAYLKMAYTNEGWALYLLGRWEESIQASARAVELDPANPTARFNLGLALLQTGDRERARSEYEKGMELNDLRALTNDGIKDLRSALRQRPELPGAQGILDALEARHAEMKAALAAAANSRTTAGPGLAR